MSPSFTLHDGLGHPVRLPEDGQAFDDEDVGGRDCEGSDASSDVPDQFPVGYTIDFAGSASGSPHAEVTEDGAPRGGSGSQVLPVAEGLAAAHSGVPTDGAEYLYLVRSVALQASHLVDCCSREDWTRQEARSRPKVVARGNPFATLTSTTRPRSDDHGTRASPWSDAFEARFRNVRAVRRWSSLALLVGPHAQNICQNLAAVTSSTRGRPHLAVPAPRDESNWRLYIDGRAGASGNQQGHDADLHLVASLDQVRPMSLSCLPYELTVSRPQVTVTALLGHFANWLEIALERFVQTGQVRLRERPPCGIVLLLIERFRRRARCQTYTTRRRSFFLDTRPGSLLC